MLLLDVAAQVVSLLFMSGAFILLLSLAREAPSSLKDAGLTQHEAAFLAAGGFAGLLFNVPVILVGTSLLALNVGGAMVPIFISIYLLSNRFSRPSVALYVCVICGFALALTYDVTYAVALTGSFPTLSILYALVAIPLTAVVVSSRFGRAEGYRVSFSILAFVLVAYASLVFTRFEPTLGIVSEFPVFFIPLLLPALLAILAFWDDVRCALAVAYSSGALGVMVGADISRVPQLLSIGNLVGAIGGAGATDLIYLASLVPAALVICYARLAMARRAVPLTPYRYHLLASKDKMKRSILAARAQKYNDAISLATGSIDERVCAFQSRIGAQGDTLACVYGMGIPDQKKYDYWLLKKEFAGKGDREVAIRAIVTATFINRHVTAEECRMQRVASIYDRTTALAIDLAISLAIFVPIGVLLLSKYRFSLLDVLLDAQSPVPMAYILLATSFFIVYGFVFEALWGQTPGKRIVRIRVLRDDGAPISMMDSLVRNVLRAIDFLPFAYVVGGVSMIYSPYRQRMGDRFGRTVVVKDGPVGQKINIPGANPSPDA